MTAPSPTSTDKSDSSQPGSGDVSTESSAAASAENRTPSEKNPDTEGGNAPSHAAGPEATEGRAGPQSSESQIPADPEPRDLWVDELHSLTVLELHERFAQLKMRAN